MTEKGKFAFAYISVVLMSIFLLETGLGVFVFAIPLLVFAEKFPGKKYSLAILVSAFVAVISMRLYDYRGFLDRTTVGVFIMDILFPVIILAESMLFTWMKDRTSSFLRRLVSAGWITFALGLACGLFLSSSIGKPALQGLQDTLQLTFSTVESYLGIDASYIIPYMLGILIYAPVPIGLALAGFQMWVASNVVYKTDKEWQEGFALMKMPNLYFYLFAGFLVLAGLSLKIETLPSFVPVLAWNVALGLSVHYFFNGVSIVTSKIRNRYEAFTSGKMCLWIILLTIIPGVNAAVFLTLTLTGVLETWVKMR